MRETRLFLKAVPSGSRSKFTVYFESRAMNFIFLLCIEL